MDLNSVPSPYPLHQIYDIDHNHQLQLIPFGTNSSPSFFGSKHNHTTMYGDQSQVFSHKGHYLSDAYGDGYYSYEIKNRADGNDFKLILGKKFEDHLRENMLEKEKRSTTDRVSVKIVQKIEDRKIIQRRSSYSPSSSSSSSEVFEPCNNESPPHNNHTMMTSQVRVCTDCNTTKTPLWRSGPNGPKSLCNACGIRQRKARRAAMAAAAAGEMVFTTTKQKRSVKTEKIHRKEKAVKSNNLSSSSSPLKKRFKSSTVADHHTEKITESSTSNDHCQQKNGIEDFLMNLSNNLGIHRVFPQDEKEAAILLMAISSGLVHG